MELIRVLVVMCVTFCATGCNDDIMRMLSPMAEEAGREGRDTSSTTSPPPNLSQVDLPGSVGAVCDSPIVAAEGSRYIAVTPLPADGQAAIGLLVTSPTHAGVHHRVTVTGALACEGLSQTPDQWGTVHVHDELIIPNTMYTVRSDCGGGQLSEPITVTTWRYGDVNNSGNVNLDDILCVLAGFAGNYSNCSRYADDQLGFDPNGVIDLDDILSILSAFSGALYAGPIPSDIAVVPSPVLTGHTTITNQPTVTIAGTTSQAIVVEYSSHLGVFQVPVTNDEFSANVILAENRVNPLYFTAIDSCAERSAPTLTTITHDGQPPNLFIDFPADAAQVTITTTDVAGRVGDVLSGFMGLTVKVNCPACPPQGIEAAVDVGIGPNGTFNAPNVPLNLGANLITATATDVLGNQAMKQITITRADIPPNTPQMMVVSGNGQSASVRQFLSQPITVKVLKADGSPFINKVVTFNVTRSDGRLVGEIPANCYGDGTMMLQCHADANGEVRAMWKLGTDAGCGNNRIEVTSTSISGTVAFCASATPGPASQINIGSGNNQRVEINAPAPEPLRAWVTDSTNGIAGVMVRYRVTRGGGKVKDPNSSTWLDSVAVPSGETGHTIVDFMAGPDAGEQLVVADFAGNLNRPSTFVIYAVERDESQPTSFSGLLFDNALQPIGGAECKLVVAGRPPLLTLTNVQGQFSFANVDGSGASDFFVDGAVATVLNGQSIPPGSFPFLHYTPVLVPNATNALPAPVLLPPLDPCNAVTFDSSQDVTLTVRMRDPANPTCDPQTPGCCVPSIEGLEMLVASGTTVRRPDGKCVGPDPTCSGPDDLGEITLSLNQVHYDDVPMPMPDGAAPSFAWTLQPGGATFDMPVAITYPNMSGLPAGAIAYFVSFDHDANRFQIIASGHVSADGSSIVTDPNSGISKAGWGSNTPPPPDDGDACGDGANTAGGTDECEDADDSDDACPGQVLCPSGACADCCDVFGGDACTTECCGGNCCTGGAAAVCCDGECCLVGESCCGGTCCAPAKCCGVLCCGPDETCHGVVACCKFTEVHCPGAAPDGCCEVGECCGTECCGPDRCCGGTECCDPDQQCCGTGCQECCFNSHCGAGNACCNGTCCGQGFACSGCAAGEVCCNGTCADCCDETTGDPCPNLPCCGGTSCCGIGIVCNTFTSSCCDSDHPIPCMDGSCCGRSLCCSDIGIGSCCVDNYADCSATDIPCNPPDDDCCDPTVPGDVCPSTGTCP